MSITQINDFSSTASENTDINNVGIEGSSSAKNIAPAFRNLLKIFADFVKGTTPINHTFKVRDITDTSKVFGFTAANIPTATTRSIDAQATYDLAQNSAALIALLSVPPTLVNNYLTGLTLSNNVSDSTNDIDIAAGLAMNSTNVEVMTLAASLTKRLDAAWAVGTDNGGLDTGTVGNGTYHAHLIKRVDTGVVDVLFSLSPTSPTLPTNYTIFRRIGPIVRITNAILQFSQKDDEFLFKSPLLDVTTSSQGTSAILRALPIPTGINVWAKMRVRGSNSSGWAMIITSPDVNDDAPSVTMAPLADISGQAGVSDRATLVVRTNTNAEIRTRATVAGTDLQISTYGWVDTRGK